MASTTFVNNATPILAAWLNDVNDTVYANMSPLSIYCVGDNTTDDSTAFQSLVDTLSTAGGGLIVCEPGKTYKMNTAPIIKPNVHVLMNGATFRLTLTGTGGYDYGLRMRSNTSISGGTVSVESSGSVGSQAGIHAAINIGALSGNGGTVASPGADQTISNVSVRNMTLATNRDGKVAMQIFGDVSNVVVDNITVNSSSTLFGVIHLDWGYLGTIDSSNITTSRSNFDAGTAYTTHPNNILISNIKVGSLSRTKSGVDTGSHLIRLSGVYNVHVSNVFAAQCTYAAVRITAGDVGFEFAPVTIKPMRMKNIVVENVAVLNTTDSWAAYVDSYADNVASAVSGSGYSALIDPLHETNLVVRNVTAKGAASASMTAGLDIRQLRGGRFENFDLQGYQYGCLVDELVYGVQIHGRFYSNRGHGIYIHHGTNKPQDVEILPGTHCYQNGTDAGFANPAGIQVDGSIRCYINGALLGHRTAASETTQLRGIRVENNALDVRVENCHIFSVETGGVGYSLLTSTEYNILKLFRNNTADSAITTKISGLNILPVAQELGTDGTVRGVYVAAEAALTSDTTPTTGTWVQGDRIYYTDPDASDFIGTVCTTAGTPGTWKRFGATQA